MRRGEPSKSLSFGAALLAILLIAWIDYATGVEVRTYPLYFAPISWVAWHVGRTATVFIALLCGVTWAVANRLAGLEYSSAGIWIFNVTAQTSAFGLVGYLMASLRHTLERERTLSRTDALTQLPNSRAFYEEAERVLARCKRHRRPLTVAFIDVDDFKKVNDALGHAAGDVLLRAIGDTLRHTQRIGDLSARLGGDEFAILLEETDHEGARAFLQRTRIALSAAMIAGSYQVTTSVGAVTFLTPPESVDALVRKADALMYAAKAAGKNRFHIELARESQPAQASA